MKPVKTDPALLHLARHMLVENVRERLAPVISDGAVGGFVDQQFIDRFGVGLHKVTDTKLVELGLNLIIERAQNAPSGKTGLPFFDD